MRRGTMCVIFISLCLLSFSALAQENRVRVGVATMKNAAGRSVPGTYERDRLVSDLNQQKPDKKTHLAVQGVPLDGTSSDEVADEARQKKCDYVVYTTLIELRLSSDGTQRVPRGVQTSSNPPGMPGGSPGSLNQIYQATVEYKFYRADGSPVSGAVLGAPFIFQQAIPEADVVGQVIDRIASKVFAEVKKGGPPPMQE